MEMIDWLWYPIVTSRLISIKYEYKFAEQETTSFNKPIIFWLFDLLLSQIFQQS